MLATISKKYNGVRRENSMVKLEEFFDFDKHEPVNRVGYTKEDADYKIKFIQKMQELGMEITMDEVGNICGTIKVGNNPKTTLAIGSHTDSVYDGGQFDGTAGVVIALKTVEQLIKSKNVSGIIKLPIYACEESSRFGNACIGSKYLNGNITKEDFEKIVTTNKKDEKQITLKEAIGFMRACIKENTQGVVEVEKIFDKVDYALEAHTEQYELLQREKQKNGQNIIGIINSIGSAVRIKYHVLGEANHTGSTPMGERKNASDGVCYIGNKIRKLGIKYEKQGKGRASQLDGGTTEQTGSFNQIPPKGESIIDIRVLGDNTWEQALEDFAKIKRKAQKKTRTIITEEIVSKGNPTTTSERLNEKLAQICSKNNIQFLPMNSGAGQDTSYVPAEDKTMIFIPSTGGSHNPNESIEPEDIEVATKVFTGIAQELLQEKFKDRQVVNVGNAPIIIENGGEQPVNQMVLE